MPPLPLKGGGTGGHGGGEWHLELSTFGLQVFHLLFQFTFTLEEGGLKKGSYLIQLSLDMDM